METGAEALSSRLRVLFVGAFTALHITTVLSHRDLLGSSADQRHGGALLTLACKLWPRWFIRRFLPGAGLFMMIKARK